MYLDYYKLSLKPFQISTDPRFLWLGEKHQEALAVLKYGIMDNKGFLLLTGDVGTGKTTLLNALVSSLGEDVLVAMVADPGLAKLDFFNFVADSFGMDKSFKTKGEFLIYLKNFLLSLNRQNRQALLIIDECQNLNQKLLEEVRLLSNIEKADAKLINIFFVGQSEFNNIILRPQNRALRQRITINYNISALSRDETNSYIRFRLSVAGTDDSLFTPGAIDEIYNFSGGYPRLINIICDQALLSGFVRERKLVDEQIILECADELRIDEVMPIEQSDATPEARMKPSGQQPPQDSKEKKRTPLAGIISHLEMKTPLAMALIVLMIVWIGLVTIFLIGQNRSDTPDARTSAQPMMGNSNTGGTQTNVQPGVSENTGKHESGKKQSSAPASDPKDDPEKKNEPRQEQSQQPSESPRLSLLDIRKAYGVYPEVHFEVDSNRLDAQGYEILNKIAQFYNQHPETIIVLRGYTDLSGVRAYNMKLAEFRADIVKTYLVGKGVKPEAITTIAIGPGDKGPGGTTVPFNDERRKVMIEIIKPMG